MQPKKTLSVILTILIIVSIFAILYPFITNPTSITKAYQTAGIFAPLVFILLVMIAPTPGAVVGASGGAYFGIWEGAVYLFLGNLLGVSITFLLVKRYGRPAAERFVRREKLAEYEGFIGRHPVLQWLVYTLPIFPIELMTFVIALSKKKFKEFFITVLLALPVYAVVVTTVGFYLSDKYKQAFEYASIAVLVVLVYAILHFLYAWKKEEIHATGRKIGKHVQHHAHAVKEKMDEHVDKLEEGVDKLTAGVDKIATATKKRMKGSGARDDRYRRTARRK